MGVSSTTNRLLYAGDGASTSFSYPYYFFAKADIKVWLYDTLTGATVLQVTSTHYNITGTANAQGLYPNGGSVVFVSAPAATDVVVIFRDGSEVQNYALLQNGNINSAALVQQMDYLTLLIQRLEDQVARCVQLPDGAGTVFSGLLPSNAALVAGTSPMVNSSGNGWILGGGPFVWQKVTIPYATLQTAATTITVTAFTQPAKYLLKGIVIKHSVAFVGTSITALKLNVGTVGDATLLIDGFDGLASVADTTFDYNQPNLISSFANSTAIKLNAVSTGANLSALSAGSVDIWYLMQNLP